MVLSLGQGWPWTLTVITKGYMFSVPACSADDPGHGPAQGYVGARAIAAVTGENVLKVGHRLLELVIDDDVIELIPVRHVAERVTQASRDDFGVVSTTVAQAPLELLE